MRPCLWLFFALASPARADDLYARGDSGSLDVAILGGSATSEVVHGASLSAGSSELAWMWHASSGALIGVLGRSTAMETLAGETRRFAGGEGGLRAGYAIGRFAAFGDATYGTFHEQAAHDRPHARFDGVALGGGASYAFYRGESTDLALFGHTDVFNVSQLADGDSDAPFGQRLVRSQIGLSLSVFLGRARADPFDGDAFVYCGYGCADGAGQLGKLLFEGGAIVGKAAGSGLFEILRGLH